MLIETPSKRARSPSSQPELIVLDEAKEDGESSSDAEGEGQLHERERAWETEAERDAAAERPRTRSTAGLSPPVGASPVPSAVDRLKRADVTSGISSPSIRTPSPRAAPANKGQASTAASNISRLFIEHPLAVLFKCKFGAPIRY